MGFHLPKSKHKDMRNFEVGISLEHFIINFLLQKSKNMLWIFNEFFFLNFRVTLTHLMSEIVTWLAWMIWTVRNPMFRMYKLPIWMIWLKLELLVCMKTKEGEKFTNILSKVNLYCFSTLYKALYKYIHLGGASNKFDTAFMNFK